MKRYYLLAAVICLLILGPVAAVSAHGVDIFYGSVNSIEITAKYDTGEPFSGAQVSVYAPNNPAKIWAAGKCDAQGRFTFTPDPALPGVWDVQVREAGHGAVAHITVAGAVQSGTTGFTTLQMALMGACVLWGLAGTALYFSRRKS